MTETLTPPVEIVQAEAIPVRSEFVALSPYEVEQSRSGMRAWAQAKMAQMKAEREETEATLAAATKNKWATAPFRRQVELSRKREEFYRKIDLALEAGYLVIPNFQMTVFAVRTGRKKPDSGPIRQWASQVPDVKPQMLPAGDGRYVSARPNTESYTDTEQVNGKEVEKTYHYAEAFVDDPVATFPIALVKPRIISATQRALVERVFDEIGVADGLTYQRNLRADPIIMGRIRNPRPMAQSVSFFIAWTADMSRI